MKNHYGRVTKVSFEHLKGERDSSRMQATNPHTGQLQDVILTEPAKLQRHPALAVESHPELRVDLARAVEKFSRIQRRIIFRVLVQGQSIEVATRGSRKSSVYWWRWLARAALPQLRRDLGDYMENGKLVVG